MVPYSGGSDDGSVSFLQLWQKRTSGVPEGQQVADDVDLNADGTPDIEQPEVILAVNAIASANNQIGVSAASSDVVIDALEAIDPVTITDSKGRPQTFPFGLISFRASVASTDGTAETRVYLSQPAPAGARWYKYNSIEGWQDYSAYATLSADRKSVTLRLKDGDYGDADRIVNGEILEPGGIGAPSGSDDGGGGGGGCFIVAVGRERDAVDSAAVMVFTAAVLVFIAMRRRKATAKRPYQPEVPLLNTGLN
jgi:hypothetical protein